MKRVLILTVAAILVAGTAYAGSGPSIRGEYVEARTAEVFTGGCIMGSEAETVGRQAVLAWHITEGTFNNVPLDDLTVIVAVAGNRNLGIRELGGLAPDHVRAALFIDEHATTRQREALTALARELTSNLVHEVVAIHATPIEFTRTPDGVAVRSAAAEIDVITDEGKHISCGAMQWFRPLVALPEAKLGIARAHDFSGSQLGIRWSDPGKRSAYFGSFTR